MPQEGLHSMHDIWYPTQNTLLESQHKIQGGVLQVSMPEEESIGTKTAVAVYQEGSAWTGYTRVGHHFTLYMRGTKKVQEESCIWHHTLDQLNSKIGEKGRG